MTEQKVKMQVKVIATLGEKVYESTLSLDEGIRISGVRFINSIDMQEAMKKYLLRTCEDEEILLALVENDYDKKEMAFNHNLSNKLADQLVDDLCLTDSSGAYPYEFCMILTNPCVSGEKLDFYAKFFLEQHQYAVEVNDGKPDYDTLYLLRYIAKNPSVWDSTLEILKESEISFIVNAIKYKN